VIFGSSMIAILTEGGPDLLAAFHFLILGDCDSKVTAVAMLGAGNNIHPEALPLFAGKLVRIIPHLDEPDRKGRRVGTDAARRWQTQPQGTGAETEIVSLREWLLGTGKDLNDAVRLSRGKQLAIGRRLSFQQTKLAVRINLEMENHYMLLRVKD